MTSFKSLHLVIFLGAVSVILNDYGYASTIFKIATIAPEGTALVVELEEAASAIEELTDGEVQFKFYTGGVMGDDFTVKRKIRARQLHGGILQTSVYSSDVPSLNLYNLPMMFQNHKEVHEVRKQLDPILIGRLEEEGVIAIGFASVGFAYAMGTKPIGTIQEVRRSKVWSPKDDADSVQLLKVFGIDPISLPVVDVLTGLQTGLIDTIASPPVAAIALQWHNQIKYMLDVPLRFVYTIYALDQRVFNRLSTEHQKIVREEMKSALVRAEKQLITDHDEALEVMLEQGIELLTPDDDEYTEWLELAESAVSQWLDDGSVTLQHYQLLENTLEKFRSENAP